MTVFDTTFFVEFLCSSLFGVLVVEPIGAFLRVLGAGKRASQVGTERFCALERGKKVYRGRAFMRLETALFNEVGKGVIGRHGKGFTKRRKKKGRTPGQQLRDVVFVDVIGSKGTP